MRCVEDRGWTADHRPQTVGFEGRFRVVIDRQEWRFINEVANINLVPRSAVCGPRSKPFPQHSNQLKKN
jgi:hypothetical protein